MQNIAYLLSKICAEIYETEIESQTNRSFLIKVDMAQKGITPYDKTNITDSHSAKIELQIQVGYLKMQFGANL